jgi:hypothetical protein
MSGLKLAALYGWRPHALGLCGPKEAARQQILKKFLKGEISDSKVRPIIEKFRGAYPYYKLIARSNKIKDPLDERAVSAYWIGNNLLDKVKIDNLRAMVAGDFCGPGLLSKKDALQKANRIPAKSLPHHSFHVLAVGSVTGSVDFKNTKLKNLCRIGWGKIIKKSKTKNQKPKITVEYQPLVGEKKIKLGKLIKKQIIWNKEIAPEIKIGDWVSFHWDCLVQVLKKEEVENLKRYTLRTLELLLKGVLRSG